MNEEFLIYERIVQKETSRVYSKLKQNIVETLSQLTKLISYPIGWDCRIHRHDNKQSDGEVPVILEFWGIRSTPLLPSFPSPLWPGVVASDRNLSTGQMELNCVIMIN